MVFIFQSFQRLPAEKRNEILNAAFAEFGERGYSEASTNAIVKAAGISKGLLFHYFSTKRELYLFLYDYALSMLTREYFGQIDEMENDVFVKWGRIALLKMQMIKKYPDIFRFILSAAREEDDAVKGYLQKTNRDFYTSAMKKIYERIDRDKFRDGLDAERAIEIIFWTIEGYSNKKIREASDGDAPDKKHTPDAAHELNAYLGILREAMYKTPLQTDHSQKQQSE